MIKVTIQDLDTIHALARDLMRDMSIKSSYIKDLNKVRSYAFTNAVINLLNSKNVIRLEVEIDKGYKE